MTVSVALITVKSKFHLRQFSHSFYYAFTYLLSYTFFYYNKPVYEKLRHSKIKHFLKLPKEYVHVFIDYFCILCVCIYICIFLGCICIYRLLICISLHCDNLYILHMPHVNIITPFYILRLRKKETL